MGGGLKGLNRLPWAVRAVWNYKQEPSRPSENCSQRRRVFVSTPIVLPVEGLEPTASGSPRIGNSKEEFSRPLPLFASGKQFVSSIHLAAAKRRDRKNGHASTLISAFNLKERLHSCLWRCGEWVGLKSSDDHGDPGHATHDLGLLGIAKRSDRNRRFWVRNDQQTASLVVTPTARITVISEFNEVNGAVMLAGPLTFDDSILMRINLNKCARPD